MTAGSIAALYQLARICAWPVRLIRDDIICVDLGNGIEFLLFIDEAGRQCWGLRGNSATLPDDPAGLATALADILADVTFSFHTTLDQTLLDQPPADSA